MRWYLNSAHYRSTLEYSPDSLAESAIGFQRIENFIDRAESILGESAISTDVPQAFRAALDNDLAAPQALAVLADVVREGNTALTSGDKNAIRASLGDVRVMLEVLGCDPRTGPWAHGSSDLTGVVDELVKVVLEQRNSARARKDWAAADAIRDGLAAAGIAVEDSSSGSRWTLQKRAQ